MEGDVCVRREMVVAPFDVDVAMESLMMIEEIVMAAAAVVSATLALVWFGYSLG